LRAVLANDLIDMVQSSHVDCAPWASGTTGRKLVTLLDAATYATMLPKKEADAAEWQAAIESLMLVAELGGPTMFARIGIMRALVPRRKRAKAYRIVR
jgi:hypothetical protein